MAQIKRKNPILMRSIYALIVAVIAWQAFVLVTGIREHKAASPWEQLLDVTISGNVEHPGVYRVPNGMTQFEILKVAGVRPTSDISEFALSYPLTDNQKLDVGTTAQPVTITNSNECIRLEYAVGNTRAVSASGATLSPQPGMIFHQNDVIKTDNGNQVELSVNTYSKIDLDAGSEMSFNKNNAQENGKKVTEVNQKTGLCWYTIAYASPAEQFTTVVPGATISATGKGADFVVDIKTNGTTITAISGQLLLTRPQSSEAIRMVSGQQAVLSGTDQPLHVVQTAVPVNPQERFLKLTKEKQSYTSQSMPLNFLFCAAPSIYYLVSIQYDKGIVQMVYLPGNTTIDQLAPGVLNLDQAFLYGSTAFLSSIVEQLLNTRIPKYCVFERKDLAFTAGALGGLAMNLDAQSAAKLGLSAGANKLSEQQLVGYMRHSGSPASEESFTMKQDQVFTAFFEALKSKNLVLSPLLIEQILSQIKSNFTTTEVVNHYTKFYEIQNWSLHKIVLPVKKVTQNGQVRYEPVLEKCATLLQSN